MSVSNGGGGLAAAAAVGVGGRGRSGGSGIWISPPRASRRDRGRGRDRDKTQPEVPRVISERAQEVLRARERAARGNGGEGDEGGLYSDRGMARQGSQGQMGDDWESAEDERKEPSSRDEEDP